LSSYFVIFHGQKQGILKEAKKLYRDFGIFANFLGTFLGAKKQGW
jgi:hypothetical protein